MMGHDCAVTAVRYGKMEILSGDVLGRIFIWWMATGAIIRKCTVHRGPVRCMQFDSVHIVSGGVDNNVVITDIATGEVLQSLHGHTGHVLGLAFDSERILSVGGDNTVRYWQWGKKSGPTDKYHVFNKGETLLQVSKLHGLTLDTLMRWNGIIEMKQTYVGMKLLVRKGDPSLPTDAEKAAEEREIRRQNGLVLAGKKLKQASVALLGTENTLGYDRVHKLATDIDFYSLGNRLFGREKRQLELFPDQYDTNTNSKSLASRLQHSSANDLMDMSGTRPSKVRPRYFISADNEDEWGEVSDALAVTMLSMLVEYSAYEVVMEQKRALRSNQSVIGRVNAYQKQLTTERQKADKQSLEPVAEESGLQSAMSSPSKSDAGDFLERSADSLEFSFTASPAKEAAYEQMSSSAKHKKMEAKKADRARLKQQRKEQRQRELDTVAEHKADEEELGEDEKPSEQEQQETVKEEDRSNATQLPQLRGSAKESSLAEAKGSRKSRKAESFSLPPI